MGAQRLGVQGPCSEWCSLQNAHAAIVLRWHIEFMSVWNQSSLMVSPPPRPPRNPSYWHVVGIFIVFFVPWGCNSRNQLLDPHELCLAPVLLTTWSTVWVTFDISTPMAFIKLPGSLYCAVLKLFSTNIWQYLSNIHWSFMTLDDSYLFQNALVRYGT